MEVDAKVGNNSMKCLHALILKRTGYANALSTLNFRVYVAIVYCWAYSTQSDKKKYRHALIDDRCIYYLYISIFL